MGRLWIMKLHRIEDMHKGWFVGDFEPTAFSTPDFEVNYRKHAKGEHWQSHYHTDVTEINLLIRGEMILQDKALVAGDIFTLEPYEIADPTFVTDCEIVCVKTPSKDDKIEFIIKS